MENLNLGAVSILLLLGPFIYLSYICILFLMDVRRQGKCIEKFPQLPRHFLYGHLHLFPGPDDRGLKFLRGIAEKFVYGQGVWIGPILPKLTVFHPSGIKSVIQSSVPKPMFPGLYYLGREWLGDGLLLSNGNRWSRSRRLLTPAFHFGILKQYIHSKNVAAEILVNKMQVYSDKEESMDIVHHISYCTLDIMLRCAFSYENNLQEKGKEHPYVASVEILCDLWVKRSLQPFHYFDPIYKWSSDGREFMKHCKFVHSFTDKIIKQRKQYLEANEDSSTRSKHLDFLDILLTARDEDGKGLSDQEIQAETDTFLFEGHDTTSSAISWALYSIAKHPDIQAKCQQEIDDIIEENNTNPATITWDDLPRMKYLTMCIKEALRLHPPVFFIERQLEQDTVINGRTVIAGMIVSVNIDSLHHNPHVWENPEEYIPERFSPENVNKIDNFAYIPFSAGPRNCIGQNFAMHEIQIILAKVLHRFTLVLDETHEVTKKLSVVMKTENGMKFKILAREHSV